MAALTYFHVNTVDRNDNSHSMRAQRIHHSDDDGDCDSNSANDADVDDDSDDGGQQQRKQVDGDFVVSIVHPLSAPATAAAIRERVRRALPA